MSSESSIQSATSLQMDYMKLLVTQLQYQNPLEPLDNNDMAAQLAQFSQLQQLESISSSSESINSSINSNFAEVLGTVERTYANSLLGRNISFLVGTDTDGYEEMSGTVKQVLNDPENGSLLIVNTENGSDYTLGIDGVVSVKS
jgi:flagellar basal-body rod modification protein FlgD